MLSGELLPAHPHPYSGECLSSWLVRSAHANGLKVQTFCSQVFGQSHQIWNRDIDRLAPEWLIDALQHKTGISKKNIVQTTLRLYEHRLFPVLHQASQLRWVMPLRLYHRQHLGYGVQYCPLCLKEDQEPYFRLSWRVAFYTYCPKHQVMMNDCCYHCHAPVVYHRVELGSPELYKGVKLDTCWKCRASLSFSPALKLVINNKTNFKIWDRVLKVIDRSFINSGPINYDRLVMIHQVCRLLSSSKGAPHLEHYLCQKTGIPFRGMMGYASTFETRSVDERHYLLRLAWWLISNQPKRLQTAIEQHGVRINECYRDLSRGEKQMVLNFLGKIH